MKQIQEITRSIFSLRQKKALLDCDNYFPQIDRLCIIADRDMHSFLETQYDELLENCKKEKIDLFISNPYFELWLLMHYSDLTEYEETTLLANKKIGDRTQTELYLKAKLGGTYSKKRLLFDYRYKDRIDSAIENSKKYATSLKELKENIGTNIGNLLDELRHR